MSRIKAGDERRSQELWDAYVAMQLTPEQKAELRRKAEAAVDQAARDGVYERVIEIAGTVKWNDSSWNGELVMLNTEDAISAQEVACARYFATQLTAEEKAAARAEVERAGEEAGDVYELFLSLVGKVHLDYYDLDELREDRD